MNLESLFELRSRLENVAIAGLSIIGEDFRLRRAIDSLQTYTKVAPVFEQIYEKSLSLAEERSEDPSGTILDTLALIDAVLTTQGKTFEGGEIETTALQEGGEEIYKKIPYSKIKPVLEALTTTGSGRYAILSEAYENDKEIFEDYRIQSKMIAALGDPYAEIAEMIKNRLCTEGKNIIPNLKKDFDPRGKREMVRRIEIIERISGKEENDFYLYAAQEGNKEVREAAIIALRHDKSNEEKLLGFARTERGKCKDAVIEALSNMDSEETKEFIGSELIKRPEETAFLLHTSRKDWISDILAERFEEYLDKYELAKKQGKEEEKKVLGLIEAMLMSASGKYSNKMLKVLESLYTLLPHAVIRVISNSLIGNPREEICRLAEEMYAKYKEDCLEILFIKYLIKSSAKEAYERFAPYLKFGILEKITGKKAAVDKIIRVMAKVSYNQEDKEYRIGDTEQYRPLKQGLDLRWYEALMKSEQRKNRQYEGKSSYYYHAYDMMIAELYNPDIDDINILYGNYFHQRIFERGVTGLDIKMLKTCGWKDYRGILSNLAAQNEKLKSSMYYMHYLVKEIPLGNQELAEELEFLIKKGKGIPSSTIKYWEGWVEKLKSGVNAEDL